MHFTYDAATAEDIVQDAFYKFFRKYDTCGFDEFPRIIFRIVRNCCLDWLKHSKISDCMIITDYPKGEMLYNLDFLSQEADGEFLYEELLTQISTTLDKLPAKCKEVFEMSRFKNMSNEDIAIELGISVKTVKNHMTRALSEFHKALG